MVNDGAQSPNTESNSSLISVGVLPFKNKYLMTARYSTSSQVTENDGEIVRIGLRTTVAATIFSRSGPSDYWLFAQLKKWLAGRKFHSNDEVNTECETYFEDRDKSFYKKGIEILERRWTDCITLRGNYVNE